LRIKRLENYWKQHLRPSNLNRLGQSDDSVGSRYGLTRADFTASADFDLAVNLNFAALNDDLCVSASFGQTANFKQLSEFNKFAGDFEFERFHAR